MKKRVVGILLAGVLAFGALTGCGAESVVDSESAANTDGASENQELDTIRVAVMTGQLDQYEVEIGLWQGIFEKYGLNVEATEFINGISTIDAVVNNTADVGMMADYATVNRLGNTYGETDLKIYAELSGASLENSGGLYVAPQYADDIDSLDGSEGFLTTTGTVSDYYIAKAIEYLGLDYDKQNIVSIDSVQTGLALAQSGDASAYYLSGANASYFEELGWVKVATAEEIGIETGAYLLAPEGFIDENAETLAKYLQALDEAGTYIDENLDESAEYLADKLSLVADDFKANWTNINRGKGISEEAALHLEEIEKWAYENGRFETDYDIREFFDTKAVDIAFPDDVTVKLD